MRVGSDRLESLASPVFIAALALLVFNDVALKPLFHNAVTGKLSDFAGLFALTLFLATLWPRHARVLGVFVAAAFTFWKTNDAESLIELMNAVSPIAFGRTVDLTDLVAVPMIPLAVWAAPRLAPWPLPRVLQLALVVVSLVAFTATSRARYAARDTMDMTQAAAVDEAVLQSFFDEIADKRSLRCEVCVPLSEGRVYIPGRDSNIHAVIVKLDGKQTMYFTVTGYDRERGVRVLARRIRADIGERFPDVVVIDSTTDLLKVAEGESTVFMIRVPGEADARERAEAALSSIVADVARTHRLVADANSSLYHTADGFERRPEYSNLALVPVLDDPRMLLVRVLGREFQPKLSQRQVTEELATQLDSTFGAENVVRHGPSTPAAQWAF